MALASSQLVVLAGIQQHLSHPLSYREQTAEAHRRRGPLPRRLRAPKTANSQDLASRDRAQSRPGLRARARVPWGWIRWDRRLGEWL